MKKIKKIVHLIFTLEAGGAENLLVDVANEQAGYAEVSIILINNKSSIDLVNRIKEDVRFYALKREEGNKMSLTFLFQLWRLLLKLAPDVIHCHNHNIILLLPFFRNRTVLTIHSLTASPLHLKKYRKVYAVSTAVADVIRERAGIYSPVIFNGIDFFSLSHKLNYRHKKDIPVKLVQVGRLFHEIKGQDLLLLALNDLIRTGTHSNITVDFIGTGPSMDFLKGLAQELQVNENVNFLGERSRSWIYKNLHAYNILIQPSLSEGFGLTVLEGVGAGLPVIASDHAGPHEILQNMPGGYLFKRGNVDDLVNTIKQVITEIGQGNMQQQCSFSRQLADEKYSIRRTAGEYLKSYAEM